MHLGRRLAAILAADVVGFSRLMGEDEAGTLDRLKALWKDLVQPKITARDGRIVKLMGDGLLAEFPSIVEAVQCAIDIQQGMARRETDLSDDRRLALRIGINLGDVIVEGSDIYGDGVNVAARLEALAEPGGICISGTVFDHVQSKVGLAFADLGEMQVKNIARPLRVYRIALDSTADESGTAEPPDLPADPGGRSSKPTAADSAPSSEPATEFQFRPRPVIAVLPFVNMSRDPDQEFFADGLTEDIITRLSYLRGLDVISRTSSFVFKGQAKQVWEISTELGAGYVLEGSVRTSGERLRVVAQLIDGETGAHLWAQKYDQRVVDVFDLQDEITHAIVLALQIVLTDGELALDPGGTEDYAAWELFQQGAQAHLKYTAEDNLVARSLYAKAFERDPGFIDARVFHAWTYWQHARSGFARDRASELSECRRLLDGLIAQDAATANVKHLESTTLLLERSYEQAVAVSAEAVSLGPSKLFGYTPAAIVNIYTGQFQAAADILRETIRSIPYTPSDTIYNLAWVLGLMGDRSRSVSLAEEYMRRVPADLYAYTTLAVAYGLAGSPGRASETIDAFRERYPSYRITDFEAHEPFRDPAMLSRVVEVLRAAGLPD